MTSKEKTSAFAVIQGILSKNGPAGFYDGIQVRRVFRLVHRSSFYVQRLALLLLLVLLLCNRARHSAKNLASIHSWSIHVLEI